MTNGPMGAFGGMFSGYQPTMEDLAYEGLGRGPQTPEELFDPVGTSMGSGAEKQTLAALMAQQEQQKLLEEQRGRIGQAGIEARDVFRQYGGQAAGALQAGFGGAQGYLGQGFGFAGAGAEAGLGALYGGLGSAEGFLGAGLGAAGGTLGGLGAMGAGFIPGATTAVDAPGARSRLGEMYEGDFDLQMDPGYQFRLAEGEKALARRRAAGGGRFGGAALREAAEFGQGLASQEYGAAFGRQAGLARGADIQGMQQAGMGQQAALQAQRNQMGLAQLGLGATGRFGELQYGAGQQMAGYGFGAGQGAAGIYGGLSGQQLGLLGGQAGYAAGGGQALANLYGGMGGQIGATYPWGAAAQQGVMGAALGVEAAPVSLIGSADVARAQQTEADRQFAMNMFGAVSSLGVGALGAV